MLICLHLFYKQRPVDFIFKRIELLEWKVSEVEGTIKILVNILKNNLINLNITIDIALQITQFRNKIHVVDHKYSLMMNRDKI